MALEWGTATARVLSGASMSGRESTIQGDYAAGTADVELIAGDNGFGSSVTPLFQAINSWETGMSSLFTALQAIAANTVIKMVDEDQTLQSRTISAALLYLINQMNIGLAAPAQPTVAGSGSGSTVTNGTYTVAVTYTGTFGETLASVTNTATTTGTQNLLITSPGSETGATGWYAYVSQVGGTTLTRQQALGSPTAIGTNLTISAPPTSTGAAPPAVNTAITATVNATTVSVGAQTAVNTPNGNAIIVVTSLNGFGQTHQYSNKDLFTFVCTADAQTGGATAGQEFVTVTGQAFINNSYSFLWPGGSGISTQIPACSSEVNNSGAATNVLQNSSFNTFTNANVADNWTIATGTAGTQVVQASGGNAYRGANSISFVGDGSTLTAITQLFNQAPATGIGAGGTSYQPLPTTPYAVNGWLKLSAGSPAAGILEIALIDGSGNIINDGSNTPNVSTVTLTSIADTNWHNFNAVFRLPPVLPTTIKLRIRLSTALSSGKTVYIDAVAMNPMAQLYKGGPAVSIFSGNSNLIKNDTWTLAYTPTWGQVQLYLERTFGMKALGLRMPAATASSTVNDNVIA